MNAQIFLFWIPKCNKILTLLQWNLPEMLKSSSGGGTPVRQLKKRAAQRKNGAIPVFTLSTKELPETSGRSLMRKPQNKLSNIWEFTWKRLKLSICSHYKQVIAILVKLWVKNIYPTLTVLLSNTSKPPDTCHKCILWLIAANYKLALRKAISFCLSLVAVNTSYCHL